MMPFLLAPTHLSHDSRYIYTSGMIRGLQARMLNASRQELMLQAQSPQECLALLGEIGSYEEGLTHIRGPRDYHILLRQELEKTIALIKKYSYDSLTSGLFLLKYDVHNLKVLIKNAMRRSSKKDEFSEDFLKDILFVEGNIPSEVLAQCVDNDKALVLSLSGYLFLDKIASFVQQILRTVEKTQQYATVDREADRFYYQVLSTQIDSKQYPELAKLIAITIDLVNIKCFFRAKRFSLEENAFRSLLFPGGTLSVELFFAAYDHDYEGLGKRLAVTAYGELVKEIIMSLGPTYSFHFLDSACRNFFMRFLRNIHYISYSLDVLIGYLLAKEEEMNAVRTIFIGKICGFSAEQIRARTGMTYV